MQSRPHYYCLLALAMLLVFSMTTIYAQVDTVKGGVVTQKDFSTKYALVSSRTDNLQWVKDPAGSTRDILEIRTRTTDGKIWGAIRTEIALNRDYIRKGVRWYAMSMYFPNDWQIHKYPVVVGQLHTSQKSTILSPPVSFVVSDAFINLELYSNHRSIDSLDIPTRANSAHQFIRLDRMKPAQWYCFVVRADWSARLDQGALKVWMNGEKVYEANNHYNSYETWLGNYPRVGLYMPGMTSISDRLLYVDFIHVGGARTSYQEMADKTPCPQSKASEVKP